MADLGPSTLEMVVLSHCMIHKRMFCLSIAPSAANGLNPDRDARGSEVACLPAADGRPTTVADPCPRIVVCVYLGLRYILL